jgi:hypothetical protein
MEAAEFLGAMVKDTSMREAARAGYPMSIEVGKRKKSSLFWASRSGAGAE